MAEKAKKEVAKPAAKKTRKRTGVIYNPNNAIDYSTKVLDDYDIEISCPSGLRIPQI